MYQNKTKTIRRFNAKSYIMALLLVLGVILVMAYSPAWVKGISYSLLDEDFDGGATSTLPSGWTTNITGRATTVEDPSSSDKSMKVENLSGDSESTTATKDFAYVESSGVVTVTYKFKAAQTNINPRCEDNRYPDRGKQAPCLR
jgi:hypothetical protein